MSSTSSKLKITGYPKFVSGDVSGSAVATFSLQVNPDQLQVNFDLNSIIDEDEEPNSASGIPVGDKNKAYSRQKLSFEFIVDNTGIFPNQPTDVPSSQKGMSIKKSIDKLRAATIKPTRDSHQPPYVHVVWGTAVDIKGKVSEFGIAYTRFNSSGEPIRAKISLSVVEEIDESVISREFQSPDITRIPTIKDEDTIITLCEEFYDDPKYFIRVAEFNHLPTFRKLKAGSVLQFPPLEK